MSEFVEMTPANIWFSVAMLAVLMTSAVLGWFLKHGLLVMQIASLVVGVLFCVFIHYEVITLSWLGAAMFLFLGFTGVWSEINSLRRQKREKAKETARV